MSATPDPSRPSSIPAKATSPSSPPLPHREDPPIPPDDPPSEQHQAEDEAYDNDDDEIAYPEPGSEHTLLPPPDFNPFFTIVEDTTTGEHYHPLVHYVFADDDPAIVTAAAMRSMGLDDTKFLPRTENTSHSEHHEDISDEEEGHQEDVVESPLPPPLIGGREHYLIIDVAADGHTVTHAQSMSPDWQITKAGVRNAPSFDHESPNQGYMLQIEGVEMPGKNKGKAKGRPGDVKLTEAKERSKGDVFGALDGLVRGIEGGLEVAGRIAGRRDEGASGKEADIRSEEIEDVGAGRDDRAALS
ncbi:hypothetical protein CC80DRAFT_427917 [Byssothecium circinans]|uniref:Uncharacterized protein n=1 Tax=Byssothecium circinans TaxID=147558 RepID=A0A6A5TAF4_9PLEO|nr:hypothetical protein CC80DRAFT_427917 [Byssothecium circinans]